MTTPRRAVHACVRELVSVLVVAAVTAFGDDCTLGIGHSLRSKSQY